MKNIKTEIKNLINRCLGIDALTMRLQTSETLVEVLRLQVKEQEAMLEDIDVRHLVVQSDIEDFITERGLNDAMDEWSNEQDWDLIVSDALGERHCSSMIEDAISEYDLTEHNGFQVAVATALTTELEEDTDGNLASTIKNAIDSIPTII